MAKYYGDIPCVKLENVIHITKSGTECLCGRKWKYIDLLKDRPSKRNNIIWRELEVVTCENCRNMFRKDDESESN